MPLQRMDFQPDQLGEMLLKGLQTGQGLVKGREDAQAQHLKNAIQDMYGVPQAGADLQKSQLYNQYYGRDMESQIAMHNAMSGLYGEQAKMEAYKRLHPYLIGSNQYQVMASLMDEAKNQGGGQGGQPGQQMPQGGQQQPMPQDAPGIPGQESFSGWQPPQRPMNPQQAALQQAMQQRNGGLQIPAGSMDVLKPQSLTEAMQQSQMAQQAQNQQPQGQDQNQDSGFPQTKEGLIKMMQDQAMADMKYKKSMVDAIEHKLKAASVRDLTPTERGLAVAQVKSLANVSGPTAQKMLESGKTIEDIAKENGYDPKNKGTWPNPDAAPTNSVLSRQERANVANAAIKTVMPEVTKALAPFAKRIAGVSPSMIKNIISGKNPDETAKALAAYAIGPELAALRINAQGGNVGIYAIRDITQKAQMKLNTLGLEPGSAVFTKTQEQLDNWIAKINEAENRATFGMPSYQAAQQQDQNNLSDRSIEDLEAELKHLEG